MGRTKLVFFWDDNFRVLRDQMVASIVDDWDIQESFVDDLGVMPGRAGGGLPMFLYKREAILRAFKSCEEGEVFVFCDVDIQFFKPVLPAIMEAVEGKDLVFQREFVDIGVNMGFFAVRVSERTRKFLELVFAEVQKFNMIDQRVAHNMLYSEEASKDLGIAWDRFPESLWATSQAFSGSFPENILMQHANFLPERCKSSSDPSLKVEQLALVRSLLSDKQGLQDWVGTVQGDSSLVLYRERHFGRCRPGPCWSLLSEDHPGRPGGYSEKKAKKQKKAAEAAAANTIPTANDLLP